MDQQVPRYMAAVRAGEFAEAVRITRLDNPLPTVLGRVCDHLCENTCIRTHLDQPLAIRQIKRFIMEQERDGDRRARRRPPRPRRVAIVGAGPAGLAAAEWLAYAGVRVTIFEEHPYAGGMVGGAIPSLPAAAGADRPGPRLSSSASASRSGTASAPASTSRSTGCARPGSRPSSWRWAPSWRSDSACRARTPAA